MINFELIDRIQDILSIPIAFFFCVMLWKIRKTQLKQMSEEEEGDGEE